MPVPLPHGVAEALAEVKAALAALERAVGEQPSLTAGTTTTTKTPIPTASALEAALAAVAAAEAAAGRSLSSSGIDKELSAARMALRDHERATQKKEKA